MPHSPSPDIDAIRGLIDARGELSLRVVPGARVERAAIENGILKIWTRTAAEDGLANRAVLLQIAELLDLPIGNIELLSGATSRQKRVSIRL